MWRAGTGTGTDRGGITERLILGVGLSPIRSSSFVNKERVWGVGAIGHETEAI